MKKIKLILPFLQILVLQPSIILKAIYHAVVRENGKKFVVKKQSMEKGLPEIDILDLFPSFKVNIDVFTHLYGTSLPIDIGILKMLTQQFTNGEYLEIGTWRGESVANIAPYAKHCVSISLSNEEMGKYGWNEPFQNLQRFFSKKLPNVDHIEANSRTYNFKELKRKFDLIFIDGDHSFEGVKSDTINVFNLLRDENSIIVWHDYTSNYEHINWEVFAGILAGIPTDKHQYLYHISNSSCAIYLRAKIKNHPFIYPSVPNKNFQITIQADRLQL